MIAEENAEGKWSEKKMENEDGLRTVECLRGRLIAERAASRKAKEDAELMGNKLIELETKLKEESKSRNKAEKKLKYFMKKLESMNICHVSDESEYSSLFDKSEISSVTSTTPTSSSNSQEFVKNAMQMTIFSKDDDNNSKGLEFSNSDANSSKSSVQEEGKNEEDEKDLKEDNVNNSLALVPIDLPKPKQTIDPIVLDATVREVLNALRHAKEKLQTQMERGRGTIKVG
ncbi:uncharacterized protein LOC129876533 [Solanum dulcamara]|uniref:uncharacterized protein LOC129876533 n=1 Tax=Solanum dulcamara TaxID=45834 RepID=UPI002485A1EF|nr:uncharacterized protein LOC129876533 [Solanum dulcamara]